jgi:hypothetical protein
MHEHVQQFIAKTKLATMATRTLHKIENTENLPEAKPNPLANSHKLTE